jgi:DNA-binding HxlR family transcriptional regulator
MIAFASMDKNDTVMHPTIASETVPKVKATSGRSCPVAAFQKMISGKYKLRIIWDLKDGPLRYGQIRSGLLRGAAGTQEIAPRVLSRELKALAESGLVDRKDYGIVPPKVEYRLTAKGRSFVPVVAAIRDWGERHLKDAAAPPARIAAE